jgi:hypothetical protein
MFLRISGTPQTVVLIHKMLNRAITTFESNYELLIENVLNNAAPVPMEED